MYTGKKFARLLPLAVLPVLCTHTCNNTDGNKFAILSGIACYCSEVSIVSLNLQEFATST